MNETTRQAGEVLDRDTMIDKLNDLIELDFDAVKAYEKAIEHIDDDEVRDDLELFKLDHERHIRDLTDLVMDLGGTPKTKGDVKGVLLEGMTALRSVTGTMGALRAMRMNEKHTNRVYAKAAELAWAPIVRELVDRNLLDERRHLIAITAHIERLSEDQERDEEIEDELEAEERPDRPGAPVV